MPRTEGYRVSRLKRRRRGAAERWQVWLLYALAAGVAFAAVLGAWDAAGRLIGGEDSPSAPGSVSVIELTGEDGEPVAAALLIHDAADGGASLHVVPAELLLETPEGAYVFAADSLRMGSLKPDLQRVVRTEVDAVHTVPAAELARLVAADEVRLSLPRPLEVDVAGEVREIVDGDRVPVADLGALFGAESTGAGESAELQAALWLAVVEAAALRPADVRERLARELAGAAGGTDEAARFADALAGLLEGDAAIGVVPSTSRVAEGQFALVPDPEGIMADITRKAPGYRGRYTVQVRNGTGVVGAGEAVARRLAVLDVGLPPPTNADSFTYRQTQILAGRDALRVAEDIRAILGRGVVLDGAGLPPDTVVVIVGADLEPFEIETKDEP
jgi:hypothetical protein